MRSTESTVVKDMDLAASSQLWQLLAGSSGQSFHLTLNFLLMKEENKGHLTGSASRPAEYSPAKVKALKNQDVGVFYRVRTREPFLLKLGPDRPAPFDI